MADAQAVWGRRKIVESGEVFMQIVDLCPGENGCK